MLRRGCPAVMWMMRAHCPCCCARGRSRPAAAVTPDAAAQPQASPCAAFSTSPSASTYPVSSHGAGSDQPSDYRCIARLQADPGWAKSKAGTPNVFTVDLKQLGGEGGAQDAFNTTQNEKLLMGNESRPGDLRNQDGWGALQQNEEGRRQQEIRQYISGLCSSSRCHCLMLWFAHDACGLRDCRTCHCALPKCCMRRTHAQRRSGRTHMPWHQHATSGHHYRTSVHRLGVCFCLFLTVCLCTVLTSIQGDISRSYTPTHRDTCR